MEQHIINKEIDQFGNLELIAKQVVEGFITGLHKSPFHGFSVEFAEHRLYNTGESTRYIDWKLFARTEKLFVKRFEEETNLRCQIIIDNSSSMYYPEDSTPQKGKFNKISFSVYCAAALIYILKKQRDAVGLGLFSDEIELHTQARSSTVHHKMLFSELDKLLSRTKTERPRKTNATEALHFFAENIHKRSLIIIFSDMLDNSKVSAELLSALQHLRHNKHEVILFHVVDKSKELDFEFENRPYKFIDLETNEEVKLHPNEIKDHYQKTMSEYKNLIKLKCGQYNVDFVEADINKGFRSVLLPYLLKREKLY
ncbi:MAG: DUF58 domain-containing protein [Bacteroidetes bacterium]|nr:DUF58 domain-containing protein [Bacteroidota bacterium]